MIHTNTYMVNEIFESIQGEGIDTGRLVTFVRFSGCNLACSFCDTDSTIGETMTVEQIAKRCSKSVVFTGGEPLMQPVQHLARYLWNTHYLALETNGTIKLEKEHALMYSSITLSPKVPIEKCGLTHCDSLKILFPYLKGITAESYACFEAEHRTLQVIDPVFEGKPWDRHITDAIKELKRLESIGLTEWRLGIQLHKLIGVK